jgi:ABC-type transporter Mla subunit MlaD
MPKREHNELMVGLFTLLAVAAALGVLVWLGATDLFREPAGKVYFFSPGDAGGAGLKVGDPVHYGDLPIGEMTDIRYIADREGVLYVAQLSRSDIPVRADAQARVATGLLGGGVAVITDLGDPDAGPVDADDPIRIGGGLNQAMSDLADAAESLSKSAQAVEAQFDLNDSEAVLAKVHAIIDDVKAVSGDAVHTMDNILAETRADRAGSLLAKVHVSATNVRSITANLLTETDPKADGSMIGKVHHTLDDVNEITGDARPKIADTLTSVRNITGTAETYVEKDVATLLAQLREINTELTRIVGDLRTLTSKARDTVVLNQDNFNEMMLNMKAMSANLNAAAKEIRRNPWRLLHRPDEEHIRTQNVYDAARAFAEGAGELDDAITRLRALREARPEGIRSSDPELKKVLGHLRATFERFRVVEDALWEELRQ